MKKPEQIISELESVSGRLEKEAIVKQAAESNNDDFFAGCRMAIDCMVTFGVKQVPERTGADGPGLSWQLFNQAAQDLINRTSTGHAARDLIRDIMNRATNAEWNGWYRRILIKDLRCGVSEKTINKVLGKGHETYRIPVFTCQLAHDSNNHEGKVTGKKLLEVKLDGVRVLTIVYPDGRVDQFSRNGKELVNFPHIKEQIAAAFTDGEEAMVLDGEVMSASFQDLMKQVHRKSDVKSDDAVLNLFDIIPLKDFEQGIWRRKQSHRSEMVRNWVTKRQALMPNVTVLEQELVDLDTEAGQQRFKELNRQAIEGGYEGIMIKDPDAPYELKRSHAWLKLKPFIEVTLEVVATEEGTGKNEGKLGALVCAGVDDGRSIRVNVGSGFSDDQRSSFWADRDDLIGDMVEVRADAVTRNQDGSYSLRFPRFLHFRGFAPGEKL